MLLMPEGTGGVLILTVVGPATTTFGAVTRIVPWDCPVGGSAGNKGIAAWGPYVAGASSIVNAPVDGSALAKPLLTGRE